LWPKTGVYVLWAGLDQKKPNVFERPAWRRTAGASAHGVGDDKYGRRGRPGRSACQVIAQRKASPRSSLNALARAQADDARARHRGGAAGGQAESRQGDPHRQNHPVRSGPGVLHALVTVIAPSAELRSCGLALPCKRVFVQVSDGSTVATARRRHVRRRCILTPLSICLLPCGRARRLKE